MSEDVKQELIALTRRLLDAIARGDWDAYQTLCDPSLTAFEPEARGQLVEGLEFHRFYFTQVERRGTPNVTIGTPHVRLLGTDSAVVSYVRLVQTIHADGTPGTSRHEETRVWRKQDGAWRLVHLHRSANE